MSKSNASAKNRRAYGGNPPPTNMSAPQPQNQKEQSSQNSGFTLQQVIGVIDRRLVNLETFMKESKENSNQKVHENIVYQQENELQTIPESDNSINDILNEFNTRFDMIAEEITSLKDIVLKLQSYTMDVNKTLLEERIHILSDLGSSSNNENEPQLFDLIQQEQVTSEKLDLQALVKEEFNTSE